MTNKTLEWKRLGIFLLLAFAITWIPWIIFNSVFGYKEWFESGHFLILVLLSSYGPALANVLTRKITKEGWQDSMLHLRLKGNLKYYIIALIMPTVISVCAGILITVAYGQWDWAEISGKGSWKTVTSLILNVFAIAPIFAFVTFGEEFGWRAYMNPKMESLLGAAGTCIIGGIIWGVWHAPLTVCGHNFGTDYPGFPVLGILLMSLYCIFEGIILMWLTKKTGSIYPAAIMHSMNNNGGAELGNLLISGVPDNFKLTMWEQLYTMIPTFVIGIVFLLLMLRDNKKKETNMGG